VQKRKLWGERLGRYRVSGLTVARFCASEGVSLHTFYYWSKRVEKGSAAASSGPRSNAAEFRRKPAGHAHGVVGTEPSALVRFHFNAAVEVSVPANCLDAIRCLAQYVQHARTERSGAFQEVVVARR
ncbi:MAG TPA: hypothetical protein VHZ24_18900, partial [Pirellulales bacterium]|nr:hypothetical protein [Pirellulales bacterium]